MQHRPFFTAKDVATLVRGPTLDYTPQVVSTVEELLDAAESARPRLAALLDAIVPPDVEVRSTSFAERVGALMPLVNVRPFINSPPTGVPARPFP
jgi:hypothetical protein